jgi:ferric-chelate reductase (NADPH)
VSVARPQEPGRLVSFLLDLSTREAEVTHVEAMGPHLRSVTLGGEQLRGASWTPGDMVQLILSGAALLGPWELRSYTPWSFDRERGSMQILGLVHGKGPGSDWFSRAEVGTRCRIVGPRAALSLLKPPRPGLFFGDETSFSTAAALRATPQGYRGFRFVFEVTALDEARAVLATLGLTSETVSFVSRAQDERHLEALERGVLDAWRSSSAVHGILTGKASSIQRLYRALRAAGVASRQVTNVPYWAPGKPGLKGHGA